MHDWLASLILKVRTRTGVFLTLVWKTNKRVQRVVTCPQVFETTDVSSLRKKKKKMDTSPMRPVQMLKQSYQ